MEKKKLKNKFNYDDMAAAILEIAKTHMES